MTTAPRVLEETARIEEPRYEALTEAREGPCISIYTNRDSAEQAKNGLKRLKDLLRGAASNFEKTSMTVDDAERLLESNWELIQGAESARASSGDFFQQGLFRLLWIACPGGRAGGGGKRVFHSAVAFVVAGERSILRSRA